MAYSHSLCIVFFTKNSWIWEMSVWNNFYTGRFFLPLAFNGLNAFLWACSESSCNKNLYYHRCPWVIGGDLFLPNSIEKGQTLRKIPHVYAVHCTCWQPLSSSCFLMQHWTIFLMWIQLTKLIILIFKIVFVNISELSSVSVK